MDEETTTELRVMHAKTNGKLDTIQFMVETTKETLEAHIKDNNTQHLDHEKRVRTLEQSKWKLQGIAAVVAASAAGVVALVSEAGVLL